MRLPLVLAALLALADPAAPSVLIVRYPGATSPQASGHMAQLFEEILTERGATWTEVSAFATSTANLKLGNLVLGSSTLHYDAVLCINFDRNTASPCAHTLSANWPSVPFGIVGAPYNCLWDQAAASCSTGVTGYSVGREGIYNRYSAYLVGQPYVWKTMTNGFYHLNPAAVPPGIFRHIVRDGPTQASRPLNPTTAYGASYAGYNALATFPDSMGFSSGDSLLLWARYRSSIEPAPLIFATIGQGGFLDVGMAKMVLAMMDSASGGKIFDNDAKRTRKMALWVGGAFSRCRWDSLGSSGTRAFYSNGTFCSADSCDSANVKAGIDSLNRLGIKYTVGVAAESIAAYAHELAWWKGQNAHYGIETSYTTPAASGNASATLPIDPLGHVRTRNMIGPGQSTFTYTPATADTSSYALLFRLAAMIERRWPGRFAHAIRPSFDDYSPQGDTRAIASRTRDTLNALLVGVGITAVLTNPNQGQGNVGRGWGTSSGAPLTLTSGTDPLGMDPVFRTERAPSIPAASTANGAFISLTTPTTAATGGPGSVTFLPYRGEFTNAIAGFSGGHDMKSEWDRGKITGDSWYSDWSQLSVPAPNVGGQPFYQHDFFTSTPVMYVPVGLLGGAGRSTSTGTGPPVTRSGWCAIRWIEMERRAVNALMIPGRTLDEWDWVENITTGP